MRKIKFRGKCTISKKWVYGNYYYCSKEDHHFILPYELSSLELFKQQGIQVIPETVGQYTGLNDEKGKDLYEGDIALIYEKQHTIETIEDAGYMFFECTILNHLFLIIGNVHEPN